MMDNINIKTYTNIEFNKKEILRYSGCKSSNDEINGLIESCLEECKDKFIYKVSFRKFNISSDGDTLDLSFARLNSKGLKKNLDGCFKIILFAATVGIDIDRLIMRYSRSNPAKALIFQAIGAERIEALCDAFNEDMQQDFLKQGLYLRPRFSPGYGDLPLDLQKDIFRILDCQRKIGLTLNESLLMSPSKSVTAIIGVSEQCRNSSGSKCKSCNKTNCVFRGE